MKKLTAFYQTAIVATTLICLSTGFAGGNKGLDQQHPEKEVPVIEQHAPHEHGAAILSIAIDANQLEIDLESPADNIFGFEYMPSSDADKQKVEDAVKRLKAAKTLFTMPEAALCHLDQVEVASPMLEHSDDNKKAATEHQHAHNDVDASWHYSCQSTEQLKSITPHFFSIFSPGFKKLKVEWLTPSGASSRMLTEDKSINLKGASD